MPSAAALARIDAYMKNGGTVLFDTRKVVFALRIQHAEYGICVGASVDMRYTEIIADDRDVLSARLQPLERSARDTRRAPSLQRTLQHYEQYTDSVWHKRDPQYHQSPVYGITRLTRHAVALRAS